MPTQLIATKLTHRHLHRASFIQKHVHHWTRRLATLALAVAVAVLAGAADVARADAATNAPATTNAPPYRKKADKNILKRLNEAFGEQFGQSAYSPVDTNAPVRRIGLPPFDSPPYATQEWQLGGGPNIIGDPGALRDSPYPLMQAIYDGPNGEWWYNSRLQFYGWVTTSGNISSSHNSSLGQTANFPQVYNERPNRVENEQDVLYIERMADMNQVEHLDWGFRLAFLYGLDYRFMASKGYINDQNLFVKNKFNGFDTPMMYANFYVPNVFQGMNVIIGRIISLPDIEQQLAPNNLMATHSLVYSFDNYTMWGIWPSIKLDQHWTLQLGLASGVDIAPFGPGDPGRQPTGSIMLQYVPKVGGKNSFYVGMNSFNNGDFGFNNLQECIESYTHKFNETWWTTFEGQYMYTRHAITEPTPNLPYVDGFYPTKPGYVWTGGILNYTCCRIAPNAFLTFRNEWWDDPHGYRSAYSSTYYEGAVGMNWWPTKLICLRPELRFDHSFRKDALASSTANFNSTGAPEIATGAYDNGTRQSQFVATIDLTFHF